MITLLKMQLWCLIISSFSQELTWFDLTRSEINTRKMFKHTSLSWVTAVVFDIVLQVYHVFMYSFYYAVLLFNGPWIFNKSWVIYSINHIWWESGSLGEDGPTSVKLVLRSWKWNLASVLSVWLPSVHPPFPIWVTPYRLKTVGEGCIALLPANQEPCWSLNTDD